jgi:hypothetical protein
MRSGGLVCVAVLAICGCTTPGITADAPKTVRAHPLLPYQIHEECFKLALGDRVEYGFESTEPVAFNLHYHAGNAVVMPVVREGSREDAGIYAAQMPHGYCLMWEAGPAGATIDYRILVKLRDS